MIDVSANYTLKILNVTIDQTSNSIELCVQYQGLHDVETVNETIKSIELLDLMKGCEIVAQRIFHNEFRLNNAVELSFTLADENGLALWHTSPALYLKCPLTMSMKWSCLHLSNVYKTMTTLGIIELPSKSSLEGNRIDVDKTAKVIIDAMANGVEFMGNIMLMRGTMDHDSAKRDGVSTARLHH